MLIAEPTGHCVGVGLYGDYWDLTSLRDSVHLVLEPCSLSDDLKEFVAALAYDLRKAYEDRRETRSFGAEKGYDRVSYRGVKIAWPTVLFQAGILRWSLTATPAAPAAVKADIFRLEHCLREALLGADADIGKRCIEWLLEFPGVLPADYPPAFVETITYRYIFEGPKDRGRFQRLPDLLTALSPRSPLYRAYRTEMETRARKAGCRPNELADFSEWPPFRW